MTKDKPKKSKRRENHETELLKDDLRVVVFHPDQQQMVHGKCIELKIVMCTVERRIQRAVYMSQVGLGLRGNSLIIFGIPSMEKPVEGFVVVNWKPCQYPLQICT